MRMVFLSRPRLCAIATALVGSLALASCGNDMQESLDWEASRAAKLETALQLADQRSELEEMRSKFRERVSDLEQLATSKPMARAKPSSQASRACTHFRNIMEDVSNGELTDDQIQKKLGEVHSDANGADEVDIRVSVAALVDEVTTPDKFGLKGATNEMDAACDRVGK